MGAFQPPTQREKRRTIVLNYEPRELKYVIFRTERAVLLSPTLSHNDVVGPNVSVSSAGLCRLSWDSEAKKIRVSAYGESVTLKVTSAEGDAEILEATVNQLSL
jgi:hypothetical protein